MAKKQPPSLQKLLIFSGLFFGLLIALGLGYLIYLYAATPPVIRDPYLQHYHFRLQIVVDGQAQNFGDAKYQTPESKVSCTAALPATPIHFHDNKNQITHIHWDGITGGLLLKNYGWNYIGGIKGALGYRFDRLPHVMKVPIHGYTLPAVPKGDSFFVYSGDQRSYRARDFNDFLNQDFEVFFHHPSSLASSKPKTGFLNSLFPTAYADATNHSLAEPQLEQLNNLIGNVVILVQKTKPTDGQVKDRFNHLEPLSPSVCGG